VLLNTVDCDLCAPPISSGAFVDPFVPTFVVGESLFVLAVLANGGKPQIVDPIVKLDAVLVIYLFGWEFAMDIKPRQPVCQEIDAIDLHAHIPTLCFCSSSLTSFCPFDVNFSGEDASGCVKVKQLFEPVLRENFATHIQPFIRWLGITDGHQPDGNESSVRPLRLGWCSEDFSLSGEKYALG
jgi:hypothetical protein